MDAYWRAANYLSVGQIYLFDNPLLRRPLELGDIKHMLLGHWGTTPGQNFIYVHLNRVIAQYDLDADICRSGPGHGGPLVARCRYHLSSKARTARSHPQDHPDKAGPGRSVPFSFPAASSCSVKSLWNGPRPILTRVASSVIRLSHSFGVLLDKPRALIVAFVRRRWRSRDRESLATASALELFFRSGGTTCVPCVPILHLNGYGIVNTDASTARMRSI